MRPPWPLALVTGANCGIGLEVCRQLARAGMRVLLAARGPAKCEAPAAALAGEGLDARAVRLDVADPTSVQALARDHAGSMDVLVTNAGVDLRHRPNGALGRPRARALDFCDQPVRCLGRGAGSLAEMGRGPPGYSASKAALNALTRLLAAELSGTGVLVNSVCPGWVATDMGSSGGRPVVEGAASVCWAALLPDDGPSGGFSGTASP